VTANASNLTGTINNTGLLTLSGILDKSINGNGTTKIYGNELSLSDGASIKGTLNINNATLNVSALNTDNIFNNVEMTSGTLNLINNNINNLTANSFRITDNINLFLDADLANTSMDRLPSSTTIPNGFINVKGINLLSDAQTENTYIPFAYDNYKDYVKTDIVAIGKDVDNPYQTSIYAPIYKYNVSYNPADGYFLFKRGGGRTPGDYNPAVLSSAVNAQAGAYSAMNETFNYAFRHADYSFMPLPKKIRLSMQNKYAINENKSLPYSREYARESGWWYQPYVNFENMHLSNGPRVDIQNYGSLVGADSSYIELKRGWGTVITPYIGYNGSAQHYSGVSTNTSGGILGVTQTLYKNNFYTALTVNTGASVGDSNTMYGNDNYALFMTGIASKTGYNFEFNEGKFIIQPNYMMAYSFINTFDYTNAAGVRVKSDPLHSIQIHPTIKFMANLNNGWQPYSSVGMVWNLLNETKVTANNVVLPEMSIKPYVEYGVGIQKSYQDKFTGFLQAMMRNGGRNGVALSFGFKWAIGKDNKTIEKVQNPTNSNITPVKRKVVIKRLQEEQPENNRTIKLTMFAEY
ncbi:MAG: autotransporter outer membrane beta-barrel domain-containing protein, partial [Candidatus Avigastranaerophilus sp.]